MQTNKNIHGRINMRGNMEAKNKAYGLGYPKGGYFFYSLKISDFSPIFEGPMLFGRNLRDGGYKVL